MSVVLYAEDAEKAEKREEIGMKRMAVLCLLLLCVRAAWAEDFSAYEIKTHGFPIFAPSVIMDNGDLLFHTWDDRAGTIGEDHPWHLEWMRDGNVYRDFPYTNDDLCSWNASSFMPIGDECYVIVPDSSRKSGEGANGSMLEVYRWTDAGMEQIASIEDCTEGDIAVLREAFAVWKRESGTMQINRYEGTPLQTYQLKPENQMIQVLEAEDGTLYALMADYRNADWAYTVYALKNGAVLWQREYQEYVGMRCPGDEYLYILKLEGEGNYKAIQIERLDAEGNTTMSRTLSADRLVLSCGMTVHPENGRLMLFGKGVAASRNQYNVFVMELDQDMREISVDVRRFCYKKDYSFSVCPMPDGSVSLFSNGSGDEQQEGMPVMVPFEALQQTDRNRIELR